MPSNRLLRQELDQAIDLAEVLAQISAYASFSRSKSLIEDANVQEDLITVRHDLALASEAMTFDQNGQWVSMGGLSDISLSVSQASKGMTLSPSDLLAVASFLRAVRTVSKAFEEESYPLLHEIAASMNECPHLLEAIDRCVDLTGSIKEDATPALRSLNQHLIRQRASLLSLGRNFVKKNAASLMDTTTTTIGGRLCVLVKAADKYRFGGMIHGSSQSGQASYLEPTAFVEANNEIQSLISEIEEEKHRICAELSAQVGSSALALDSDLESLTVIDIALSKGKWANKMDGVIPTFITRDNSFTLEFARHPLIDPKKVVANNYSLNKDEGILMVTGPNMGGKTATLKTIGLSMVFAHMGFPVVAHRAIVPWYDNFWFDIGDGQSISDNLSTFSAHATRLARLIRHANAHSFILLDEIGNGTDPQEGSALAQAVLEHLLEVGATTITSTHYNEVKAFGKSSPHVLVASVEFDPQTMKPTYRFLPGVSGASYAYSIARGCGMPSSVLERAQSIKDSHQSDVQKQLEILEKQQQQAQAKQDRFDHLIQEAHKVQKQADEERAKWEKKKKKLDEDYEHELEIMLDEKRDEASVILKKMRKAQGPRHEAIAMARDLDQLDAGLKESSEPSARKQEPLKAGDYVHIESLNNHGEIQEIRKKKATVLVNGKRVQVSVDQLSRMARPQVKKPAHKINERIFESFPLELNIIGMRVEEGIHALDHYLDQAVYHNVKNVRIIHGMGTGALRNAVWDDLKKQSIVKSYSAGGPGEGGLGATIVELK